MSRKKYTRIQLAKLLGCSVSSVRRLEGKELSPRRDSRGVWYFDAEDIDDLVRRRRGRITSRPPRSSESEEERRRRIHPLALKLYDEGKTPSDAVKELLPSCDEALYLWEFAKRFDKGGVAEEASNTAATRSPAANRRQSFPDSTLRVSDDALSGA